MLYEVITQWAAVGWRDRQGIGDMANQFHYYRPTQDGRILFGGYDAIYHYGRKVRSTYENRPESWQKLASHFFTTFPQLEGLRFSHRWAGAIDSSRITSYNVCYTKLLRSSRANRLEDRRLLLDGR